MSNLNKVKQISVGNNPYDIDAKYWGNYTTDDVKTINGESIFENGGGDIDTKDLVEITYGELKRLKENNELTPGRQYRITDYVTTTVQENTQSAGHQFDIIVTALNEYALSEEANAVIHEFDIHQSYFLNSNLSAWKIWYCFENDVRRFVWADERNGKGVIYRMIDEWGNDCPYDFKNIMFTRYELNTPTEDYAYDNIQLFNNIKTGFSNNILSYIWSGIDCNLKMWDEEQGHIFSEPTGNVKNFYTFSNIVNGETKDSSLSGSVISNVMRGGYSSLPNNIFFGLNCYSNTLGNDCYYNTFGNGCDYNTFGNYCNSNTFGNYCVSNTFGNECGANTFDNFCYGNTFGDECEKNTFGKECHDNLLGNSTSYNNFGDCCYVNKLNGSCNYNTFGNNCSNNGGISTARCNYNVFGNNCSNNTFYHEFSHNILCDGFSSNADLGYGISYRKYGDNSVVYAECTTESNVATKIIDISNASLYSGLKLLINFTKGNDYNGAFSLKIKHLGGTDTKYAKFYGTNGSSSGSITITHNDRNITSVTYTTCVKFRPGIYEFIYDGTDFIFTGACTSNEKPYIHITTSQPTSASYAYYINLVNGVHNVISTTLKNVPFIIANGYTNNNSNIDLKDCSFEFTVGENNISFTYPTSWKWANGVAPVIKPNKTYHVSVKNGCAVIAEF